MTKRIYNVVLQSAIGDGATTSSETFFYDWTQIPDVPYIVSFSLVSTITATTSTTGIASLYVDLTQSYNQIAMAQTGAQSAYRGQFLGNLKYMGSSSATTNYLYAETNTNPLTYLNGRPRNNNFTAEIHSSPTVDFIPVAGPYCLILSFQEC